MIKGILRDLKRAKKKTDPLCAVLSVQYRPVLINRRAVAGIDHH